MLDLNAIEGFDWDDGNLHKNWEKHQVSGAECEQVFFNLPLLLQPDLQHSQSEMRYFVLGQTDTNRALFIAFTIRNQRIRIISARNMSREERKSYAKANS